MTGSTPTAPVAAASPLPAYGMLLSVMLLWGSNVVIGRFIAGDWSPFALSVWRWGVALLLLLPFTVVPAWSLRAVIRRHWRLLVLLGILSVGLFNTMLYVALNHTTAINVALINSTTPIAILLLSRLLIGTPMAPRVMAGVALGLVGAAVIITRGDPLSVLSLGFNVGDVIQTVAVLCWGLYSVLLQRHPMQLPPLVLQLALMVVGIPVIVAIFLVMPAAGTGVPRHGWDWALVFYLAIAVSLASTVLWNVSVRSVGARIAGFFNYLTPLIVAVLSTIFLDEHLRPFHAMGFVLILGGILLATLVARRG
ncbi:MAG: DMT family transporter [Reyranellaceae bacterium]